MGIRLDLPCRRQRQSSYHRLRHQCPYEQGLKNVSYDSFGSSESRLRHNAGVLVGTRGVDVDKLTNAERL